MTPTQLSKTVLLEKAIHFANANDSIWDITLEELAAALNVSPAYVYQHYKTAKSLYRELRVLGSKELLRRMRAAAIGRTGEEALRSVACEFRRFGREQKGLYALLATPDPEDGDYKRYAHKAARVWNLIIGTMGIASPQKQKQLTIVIESMLHGFVSMEINGAFSCPEAADESFEQLVQVFVKGLPRLNHSLARPFLHH